MPLRRLLVTICYLLLAIGYFALPISAHTQTYTITVTADGFDPQELEVDQNSLITFVNKDSVDHWPASNVHPTHDLYPEFDPQKPIHPGDFWIFKPKNVGTWRFHDHLHPHQRGTLTVTAEAEIENSSLPQASPGPTAPSFLTRLTNFFSSLFGRLTHIFKKPQAAVTLTPEEFKAAPYAEQEKYLTTLAASPGAENVWKFLQTTFSGEAGNSGSIHDLAHYAGSLLFQKLKLEGINHCTATFAFGCYHGFLDTAFANSLDLLPQAESACRELDATLTGPVSSCLHGIGHGVASFYQTADLEASLTACDQLQEGQEYCYDGVFMEFARSAPEAFYHPDDPLYPCSDVDEKFIFSCGRNQPTVMLQRFQFTQDQVLQHCLQTSVTSLQESCLDALGFLAASQYPQDPQAIISFCQKANSPNLQARCATAAAGELIFQEVPNWHTNSFRICDSLTTPYQASCTQRLRELMRDYRRTPPLSAKTSDQTLAEYVVYLMQTCATSDMQDRCYEEAAGLLSQTADLKTILTALEESENEPPVYARCHELTHYLSRAAFQKAGNIGEVYSSCNSTCHGGCYHGTLEQYLKNANLELQSPKLAQEFAKLCDSVQNTTRPLVYNECLHGLGHAAMFISDMDVPLSLKLCDHIQSFPHRERCYSGVFMENSSSSTNNIHPGRFLKAEDPLYPCNSLDEKYAKICYRYQSSHFALISNHDWREVANLCLQVPEPYQPDCFVTIGTNQVGFTQDQNLMYANCLLLPDKFQSTCVSGIIASFAYRFVDDPKQMIDFCSHVQPNHQESCFKQIGLSFMDWYATTDQALKECDQIPNPTQASWCKEIS
ncbi:MAG: cupredoxin domain-containing protein [Candidatus Chisholmbacteria bacterium]|nr:cupredoxin domain-containing protein [Candidatus Chisholmbacteria bacterium]